MFIIFPIFFFFFLAGEGVLGELVGGRAFPASSPHTPQSPAIPEDPDLSVCFPQNSI